MSKTLTFSSNLDDDIIVEKPISSKAFDLFGDLVRRTNESIDELAEIHSAITNTKAPASRASGNLDPPSIVEPSATDTGDVQKFKIKIPEGKKEDKVFSKTAGWEKFPAALNDISNSLRDIRPELEDISKDNKLSRIAQLTQENEMLKKEMRAFDPVFFEELEDLKYRYSKLQDIVGEFPNPKKAFGTNRVHSSPERRENTDSPPRTVSPLPLARLGYAARKSMTAVDKASIHSHLLDTRPNYSELGSKRDIERNRPFPESKMVPSRLLDSELRPFPFTTNQRSRDISSFDERPSENTRNSYSDSQYTSLNYLNPRRSQDEQGRDARHEGDRSHSGNNAIYPPSGTMNYRSLDEFLVQQGDAIVSSRPNNSHNRAFKDTMHISSNLYERRLMFELSRLPSPSEATNELVHRVVDQAGRNGSGFITVNELTSILYHLGINMSNREIEVLSTGFASNGKGGINVKEFCDAIQHLLSTILGEHAAAEDAYKEEVEDDVDGILLNISEGILLKEKKNSFAVAKPLDRTAKGLFQHIVTPFLVMDDADTGVVSFEAFCECIGKLGASIDIPDLMMVAKRYRAKGINIEETPYGIGTKTAVGQMQQSFNKWMATSGIGLESSTIPVEYTPIVKRLVSMLSALFENVDQDEMQHIKLPWVMREFALVDKLLNQLEHMKTADRRRCMMALQAALASADNKREGDVDGYAVLDALVNSGFKLQRLERIQLLRSIEELGGRIHYDDLCQVLLRSCADWTDEERVVVSKILTCMGITVFERRSWLAKLRYELCIADANQNRKLHAWGRARHEAVDPSIGLFEHEDADFGSSSSVSDPGITPSAFLKCLRNCGVDLKVEEEALLLDCLDTERLAEVGNLTKKHVAKGTFQTQGNWSVPLIYYKSFLLFCSRHCGHWSDVSPSLTAELQEVIRLIYNPMEALNELSELFKSLDDNGGRLTMRSFQVACHRSRLLANLSQADNIKLSEILAAEGNGRVDYTSFLIFLRAFCKKLQVKSSAAPNIIGQLLQNATDSADTLLPLRNWIIRNTDSEHFKMTSKELSHLLREFSVVYRHEDLESLINDMKLSGTDNNAEQTSDVSKKSHSNSLVENFHHQRDNIDTRSFLGYVLQCRGKWTKIHPRLCEKIAKLLKMSGTERFAPSRYGHPDSYTTGNDSQHMNFAKTPKGIETAAARLIMNRLRAFSSIAPVNNSELKVAEMSKSVGDEDVASSVIGLKTDCRMIEREVFTHICRSSGLPLSDEDILMLADSTDCYPAADRVRCDVIVEALRDVGEKAENEFDREEVEIDGMVFDSTNHAMRGLSEEGIFALKHLRDLLWTTAGHVGRSSVEWKADVSAIFAGFDQGGVGYITTEDFSTALQLLRAPISVDILRDIPVVPDGPGLIAYKDILHLVLQAPHVTTSLEDQASLDSMNKSLKKSHAPDKLQRNARDGQLLVTPVTALLRVMRKSVRRFILSLDDLEEAWMYMLRAFKQYDPEETNAVNPRDFCLAIGVLVEDDDLVLTKPDWTSIINYFSADVNRRTKAQEGELKGESVNQLTNVDYVEFCDAVLTPRELSKTYKGDDLEMGTFVKTTVSGARSAYASHRGMAKTYSADKPLVENLSFNPSLTTRAYSSTRTRREVPYATAKAEIAMTRTRRSTAFESPQSRASRTTSAVAATTQGQRSRLASSLRSTDYKSELSVMNSRSAPSNGYITTAAGKKIRGKAGSRSGEYLAAWRRHADKEAAADNQLEDLEIDIPEYTLDSDNQNLNKPHGYHKPEQSVMMEGEQMKAAWREGRIKVRKFYKGSSKRIQEALQSWLSADLQDILIDLQNQIYDAIQYLLSSGKQNNSIYDLLEERLRVEDRNHSDNLTIQSFYAALGSLGLPHTRIFASVPQKKIVKLLEELSGEKNKIVLGDFLALVFDSV